MIILTQADRLALERNDADMLNNKGARFYNEQAYEQAVEYYRLAAAMGCMHAVCNLGYCYMYGRSTEKNQSLAMAYFQQAADRGDIDALYKLGRIYEEGASGVEKDPEAAVYYYLLAVQTIKVQQASPVDYPSLHLQVGKALMPGGLMKCNLQEAYLCLQIAREGYQICLQEGARYYGASYEQTLKLLEDPCFETVRRQWDAEHSPVAGSAVGYKSGK